MNLPARLSALSAEHKKPLSAVFLIGLCALWFVLHQREEGAYPKLHALGFHGWYVQCEGNGRTYRLLSDHPVISHRRLRVTDRSLSLFNERQEELYYTDRFDPDAYERDDVWSFATGRDGRLIAPHKRVREVLHGDEERFEVTASLDALSVVTNAGRRLVLACELR